jgi:hypothetical protein
MRIKSSNTISRSILLCALLALACAGIVFAQGFSGSSHHPTFDIRKRPPLAFPEAYQIAVGRVGIATNRFSCVSGSCVEATNHWSTGWVFEFLNSTGERAQVRVYFNGDVSVDAASAGLLK